MTGSFLGEPSLTPEAQALYDEDLAEGGYVWNVTRLWAHQPDTLSELFALMSQALAPSGLGYRQRGVLVTAAASALGDSYCSMAWGGKLGKASDAETAAAVLAGSDIGLTGQEKAIAGWARQVARNPNATTAADVQALRDSGFEPDLRDHRLHRPSPGLLRDQRLAWRSTRRPARPVAAPAGTRSRDLRPAGSNLTAAAAEKACWPADSAPGAGDGYVQNIGGFPCEPA